MRTLMLMLLFAGAISGLELRPGDSLSVVSTADATAAFNSASGNKDWQNSAMRIGVEHSINSFFGLSGAVDFGELPSYALVRTATLNMYYKQFTANVGALTENVGVPSTYYGEQLPFVNGLLWNSQGAGYCVGLKPGQWAVSNTALLNNKESATLDCQASYSGKSIQAIVLGGFQGYDITYQDNFATAGCDVKWETPHFSNRYLVSYSKYFGYGHQSNPSMVPGYSYTGRTEASLTFHYLQVFGDAEYDRFEKSFTHSTGEAEVFPLVRFFRWAGMGPGFSFQQDDQVITRSPFVALLFRPTSNSSRVIIRCQYQTTDSSSPVITVEGSLWFAF